MKDLSRATFALTQHALTYLELVQISSVYDKVVY
jgi:hypothetical protein